MGRSIASSITQLWNIDANLYQQVLVYLQQQDSRAAQCNKYRNSCIASLNLWRYIYTVLTVANIIKGESEVASINYSGEQ